MRNPDGATAFKQQIKDGSLPITIAAMNVDFDESVKQCIDGILGENGSIGVLVNNAGIERHGSIKELTMADFKAVMRTNYFEREQTGRNRHHYHRSQRRLADYGRRLCFYKEYCRL